MGNDQPALRALFACKPIGPFRTENRAGSHVRSFDLAKKHDKWQNSHGAHLQKQLQTALILSVTFI
jgi:hypothetical protein